MDINMDISNDTNIDTRSIATLSSSHKPNTDTIPFRIDFIKNLLKDKPLEPLVNFDILDTENFTGKCEDSEDSYDTRIKLNKKIYNFRDAIVNQIGGKLTYIKSGSTGHTFHGVCDKNNKHFEYAVKVVAYPKKEKYGYFTDSRRPENAEIMMLKTLSFFSARGQTPHIVLPITSFYTDITNFVNLVEGNFVDKNTKKYDEFIERYNKNEYYNEVSILISEWANRGDLLDFIRKRYEDFEPHHWKVIFFQIISTLAVIQSKFPAFRHNDLKANNILVHSIERKVDTFKYKVERTDYVVPNIGYYIKLWDFDFSCIPGIVPNQKVCLNWTKNINVTPEQNRYYDIHYFFNTFIKKGFFPEFLTSPKVPVEAKNFVNRIVPKQYRSGKYVHERGRILINKEYTTPDNILKFDPYFEEFRKLKSDRNNQNNPISIANFLKIKDETTDDEIKILDRMNVVKLT